MPRAGVGHRPRDRGSARGGSHLGNLGICYAGLEQTARSIEYYEQALVIDRVIGNRRGSISPRLVCVMLPGTNPLCNLTTANRLGCSARNRKPFLRSWAYGSLGSCYANLGQTTRAIEYHEQALVIDREIGGSAGGGCLGNLSEA